MLFQSSFRLMTVQPFFFASVISVSFEVPMCDAFSMPHGFRSHSLSFFAAVP
jgi:hypothetical protein